MGSAAVTADSGPGRGPVVPGVGPAVIRVLVAEDMQILRDTLVAVLDLEDDIEVVAEVTDGAAIVPAAVGNGVDVAVVDIDLPGTDGLTAAAQLREQFPHCKVLILTVLGGPGNLRRALAAQVAGFLVKDTPAGDLVAAVRRVVRGERVIDPALVLAALEVPDNPLSPREVEVLQRFAAEPARPRSLPACTCPTERSATTWRQRSPSSAPATGSTRSASPPKPAGCNARNACRAGHTAP